jgi:SAM-dependent methyltransferase
MYELSLEQTCILSTEFPRDLVPLLRCSRDAGPLSIVAELRTGEAGIVEARLRCDKCAAEYLIKEGIARLMEGPMTFEIEHEMRLCDAGYASFIPPTEGWRSEFNDRVEVPDHLAELAPLEGCKVLEFGCGDGRFTILMAQMGARIIAVDISINGLRKLAGSLPSGIAPTVVQLSAPADLRGHVGLVQADAAHFHIAERSFDRALSATPLDSRDERMAMYRTIANALTDDGRYIGGVEHDDLKRRLLGMPLARRYSTGGIFIEHFDSAAVRREVMPFFSKLDIRPIRPYLDLTRYLPLASRVKVSRMLGATPFLRQLGIILLFRAERPIRPHVEDASRPGNRFFKGLHRWYKRWCERRGIMKA